ncbi:MAG TPA: sortase [Candidatus Saccharimonadales bacterium]|nr:sortase [Candidatus Saccharimonadales bacterium]
MHNNNNLTPTPHSQPPAPTGPTQEHAANAARAEVGNIYTRQDQAAQAGGGQTVPAPYNRTHQENFDWRNYHSAWQNYYQQYYQRYYYQQLQANQEKIRATEAGEAAKPQNHIVAGTDQTNVRKKKVEQLKEDITRTVKEQAKKARKSHHFVPVASALAVGLIFLFLQFNSVLIARVQAYVSPGAVSGDAVLIGPNITAPVGPEPKLIIPKINVEVPVDYAVNDLSESQIQNSLRDGATHYKLPGANALPGQFGNTVILGHSSNDIFNQGKYKFVFVLLDRLQPGDTFYLNYQSKRYIYKVTETKVIKPTEVSALQIGNSKPMATLVTCTPPGTALNRLVIFGEQISPDPSGTTPAQQPAASQPTNATIPGNEPSWLDNLWSFIF